MSLTHWVILAVGCTLLPLAIDIFQTFVPQRMRIGRFVGKSHRVILLVLVVSLCLIAYYFFWSSFLPYSTQGQLQAAMFHTGVITWLWINGCWAYILCLLVSVNPLSGLQHEGEASTSAPSFDSSFPSYFCKTCGVRALSFDHHCPFTGGCIGLRNYRYFVLAALLFHSRSNRTLSGAAGGLFMVHYSAMLFALHAWAGMVYATWLSWWPFRDCVLFRLSIPSLALPRPPPDEAACRKMGPNSLLLMPALGLNLALGTLLGLHILMLLNGVTTLQLGMHCKKRGVRGLVDLLRLRLRGAGGDKWALIWGVPSQQASLLWRIRILALPSLPSHGEGMIAATEHASQS